MPPVCASASISISMRAGSLFSQGRKASNRTQRRPKTLRYGIILTRCFPPSRYVWIVPMKEGRDRAWLQASCISEEQLISSDNQHKTHLFKANMSTFQRVERKRRESPPQLDFKQLSSSLDKETKSYPILTTCCDLSARKQAERMVRHHSSDLDKRINEIKRRVREKIVRSQMLPDREERERVVQHLL